MINKKKKLEKSRAFFLLTKSKLAQKSLQLKKRKYPRRARHIIEEVIPDDMADTANNLLANIVTNLNISGKGN